MFAGFLEQLIERVAAAGWIAIVDLQEAELETSFEVPRVARLDVCLARRGKVAEIAIDARELELRAPDFGPGRAGHDLLEHLFGLVARGRLAAAPQDRGVHGRQRGARALRRVAAFDALARLVDIVRREIEP